MKLILNNCYFPIGILGQVCCLIVSIPDLYPLSYFNSEMMHVKFQSVLLSVHLSVSMPDLCPLSYFDS